MRKQRSSTVPSRSRWTAWWRALFIGISALMLTACVALTPPLPDRAPIPANLTSPCPSLTPLDEGSGAAVLRKVVEISEQYYDCARKHKGLANAVK